MPSYTIVHINVLCVTVQSVRVWSGVGMLANHIA